MGPIVERSWSRTPLEREAGFQVWDGECKGIQRQRGLGAICFHRGKWKVECYRILLERLLMQGPECQLSWDFVLNA